MPKTPAELIASVESRIAALNEWADALSPTLKVRRWVVLAPHNLPITFDVDARGNVSNARRAQLQTVYQFASDHDARVIAAGTKNGKDEPAQAMTLAKAIEVVRVDLFRTLAMFRDMEAAQ